MPCVTADTEVVRSDPQEKWFVDSTYEFKWPDGHPILVSGPKPSIQWLVFSNGLTIVDPFPEGELIDGFSPRSEHPHLSSLWLCSRGKSSFPEREKQLGSDMTVLIVDSDIWKNRSDEVEGDARRQGTVIQAIVGRGQGNSVYFEESDKDRILRVRGRGNADLQRYHVNETNTLVPCGDILLTDGDGDFSSGSFSPSSSSPVSREVSENGVEEEEVEEVDLSGSESEDGSTGKPRRVNYRVRWKVNK